MIDARPLPAHRPAAPTVLVVDDNGTNLDVLSRRLGQAGFVVIPCDTGRQALTVVAGGGIDLVLLDMVMPEVSGVDVLAALRAAHATADLPVVVVTGRSDPTAAVEALAAGADDWIAKPFSFELLTARIDRVLARSTRLADLKRSNATLDARIAQRAIELGEARAELAVSNADRTRLIASIQALSDEVERLSGSSAAS